MMAGADDQAGFHTCGLPDRAWRVKYSAAALEEILKAALDGFLSFPFGGLEVGGVLFGAVEGDEVRIVTSRPVACEHAFGPGYTLSEHDENGLREALESPGDPSLAGLVPVGWYHSHTRSGLELSATDLDLHDRYFPEPWQVAVVVQPGYSKPSRIGLFLREPEGSLAEAPCLQFEASALGGAAPSAARPAEEPAPEAPPEPPPVEAPAGAEAGSAVEEPLLEAFPPESAVRFQERPWGKIWAAVGVAGLVLLVGWILIAGLWRKPPIPVSLALRLVEKDGRLDIRWDGAAPPVRQAQRGWLEITDGLAEVVFPLDAKLLQAGSWSMVRQSPEVRVRLRVQSPDAAPIEESAQFLGPPPGAVVPRATETPGPKEATQEEVAKLRAELESQLAESSRLERRLKELAKEPPQPASLGPPQPSPPASAEPAKAAPRRVFHAPQMVARRAKREELAPPEVVETPSSSVPGLLRAGRLPDAPVAPPPAEAPKPAVAEVAKPAPAPRGPQAGRVIWTGSLPQGSVLTIENRRPSSGSLTGELPSAPYRLGASPAEFAAGGLTVYSANPRFARQAYTEPPGPQNGWNRTVYRYDPRVARDLVVVEAPSARNGWNRIVLRSGERPLSVLLLEWEIIP
jgi:proteasome lid subunit RPN8/RPN11